MEKEVLGLIWKGTFVDKQSIKTNILKRKFTGVGFFSYFDGYSDDPDVQLSTVSTVGGLLNESIRVGFTLFLRDGNPYMLEGYTYDAPWPSNILSYKVFLE